MIKYARMRHAARDEAVRIACPSSVEPTNVIVCGDYRRFIYKVIIRRTARPRHTPPASENLMFAVHHRRSVGSALSLMPR